MDYVMIIGGLGHFLFIVTMFVTTENINYLLHVYLFLLITYIAN